MRKLTTQEFIDRARAVHGDKYDYTLSVYKSARENILIHCQKHGVFEQSPDSHLQGNGCSICSGKKKHDNDSFINQAREVHGDKYIYSLVKYSGAKKHVSICCHEHGEFKITPTNHLSGNGCPNCSGKKTHINDFVKQANLVHVFKYDYLKVEYVNARTKVIITCPEHGDFTQTPSSHLSGVGCPGCAKTGFDRTKAGFLYVLRSDCGQYMKIGITHNPEQRHSHLSRETPFSFKRIELIESTGYQIANLEKVLLAEYQQAEFTETFNGYTEWRLWSDSIRHKLISFMNKELTNEPV